MLVQSLITLALLLCVSAHSQEVVSLDVHVHTDTFEEMKEYAKRVEAGEVVVSKTLLISKSYHIGHKIKARFGSEWMGDYPLRYQLHEQLSSVVMSSPDRFFGLCGLATEWNDGVEVLTHCLQLPGMKGVKIHSWVQDENMQSNDSWERIDKIFEQIAKFKPVVLWHINRPNESNMITRELDAIVRLAEKHPSIVVILAHANDGLGLDYLASRAADLENFYIEPSISVFDWQNNEPVKLNLSFIKGLRKFGMTRVLFGTDAAFPHYVAIQYDTERLISRSELLSAKEKKLLLIENGQAFIMKHLAQ